LSVEPLEDRCMLSGVLGPATVPAPFPDALWLTTAVTLDVVPKFNPQVVVLGDSIGSYYASSPAWAAQIAPLGAVDLAIPGNVTQTVLWQLDTGLLNGTAPRVIVLVVGTNNLGTGDTPQETAAGIAAIVANLRVRQPQASILVLGILPRGESSDDPVQPLVAQTNLLLARLADGRTVRFLDAGSAFLQSDGSISPDLMGDFLHPTLGPGYAVLTNAIEPTLTGMLLGVRTASVAVGPFGAITEVVDFNGNLFQLDRSGVHPLLGGVAAAQVSFGPFGEVLDVYFTNGQALQLDALGVHSLGNWLNNGLSAPAQTAASG
jgi:beta-glucosidase